MPSSKGLLANACTEHKLQQVCSVDPENPCPATDYRPLLHSEEGILAMAAWLPFAMCQGCRLSLRMVFRVTVSERAIQQPTANGIKDAQAILLSGSARYYMTGSGAIHHLPGSGMCTLIGMASMCSISKHPTLQDATF